MWFSRREPHVPGSIFNHVHMFIARLALVRILGEGLQCCAR